MFVDFCEKATVELVKSPFWYLFKPVICKEVCVSPVAGGGCMRVGETFWNTLKRVEGVGLLN